AQAAATPWATDADLLKPTSSGAKPLVFVGPDPALHDAGDLVAVPGDGPQVGVDLRLAEFLAESVLAVVVCLPVVHERLDGRVVDRSMLIWRDLPQFEPGGEGGD